MIIGDRDFLRLTTSRADAMTSNPSINRFELHAILRTLQHIIIQAFIPIYIVYTKFAYLKLSSHLGIHWREFLD